MLHVLRILEFRVNKIGILGVFYMNKVKRARDVFCCNHLFPWLHGRKENIYIASNTNSKVTDRGSPTFTARDTGNIEHQRLMLHVRWVSGI